MRDVKLSVIIPCYNAEQTIGGLLESLARQGWPESWEVIVADNGSTDRSVVVTDKYKDHVSNLRIVDAFDKRGRSYARNVGARYAMGDSLVFCDADDEVVRAYARRGPSGLLACLRNGGRRTP